MALRTLTSEEREQLKGSTRYLHLCEWAIRNYAAYWAVHDGAGFNTEAARIEWVKNREFGATIRQYGITDNDIALKFVEESKGMQFDIVGNFSVDSLIDYMIANNKFDEIASLYTALKMKTKLF
jgi:hypothetical protein